MTDAERGDTRLRQRDYLLKISRAMTARLDLDSVLNLVIQSAVEMTHGHAGAIALRRPGGGLRVVVRYGLVPDFALDESALGVPARPRLTVAGTADAADPLPRPGSDGPGPPLGARLSDRDLAPLGQGSVSVASVEVDGRLQQVLALPLVADDAELGLILVFRSEGATAFTPLDSDLLAAFADQAAVAIQNAHLHQRLAAREQELAAIIRHDPSGVLLLDETGAVREANPAAMRLMGGPGGAIVGQPLAAVLRLADEAGRDLVLDLPPPQATMPMVVRGWLPSKAAARGAFVQLTMTTVPAVDPAGVGDIVAGYVVDLLDLTAFKAGEEAKSVFLASLSHELKTPLALIRGYAETLRLPEVRVDAATFDDAVDVILEEVEHLTRQVDQLLTAARFQSGAVELYYDEVDLRALLERLVTEFARVFDAHTWLLDVPRDLPPLVADPTRLREVFQNLLTNAAKYSPAGTTVTLSARAEAGLLRVAVEDQGMGIAVADQDRVFERFVRAADAGEGTGLGLYVCRAIVEAHGGQVDVVSQPGRGSVFTVTLPLGSAPVRPSGSEGT